MNETRNPTLLAGELRRDPRVSAWSRLLSLGIVLAAVGCEEKRTTTPEPTTPGSPVDVMAVELGAVDAEALDRLREALPPNSLLLRLADRPTYACRDGACRRCDEGVAGCERVTGRYAVVGVADDYFRLAASGFEDCAQRGATLRPIRQLDFAGGGVSADSLRILPGPLSSFATDFEPSGFGLDAPGPNEGVRAVYQGRDGIEGDSFRDGDDLVKPCGPEDPDSGCLPVPEDDFCLPITDIVQDGEGEGPDPDAGTSD